MASGLNKVMIIGYLGRDPDVRDLQSGDIVCNMSVGVSERWKDKTTDEWKDKTEWFRVNVWGATANNCAKYLQKGSKVYVEGSLQTRQWQDKEGNDRYTTEIRAMRVMFLDSKSDGGKRRGSDENRGNTNGDSDIPF